MLRLEQTSAELANFPTLRRRAFGEHENNATRSAESGDVLYREEFDPDIHEPEHIELSSIEEDLFEVPHVRIVKPSRPMGINVIVHQPEAKGLDKTLGYGEQRRDFTRMIGRAIAGSIPGITDSVKLFAVGGKPVKLVVTL